MFSQYVQYYHGEGEGWLFGMAFLSEYLISWVCLFFFSFFIPLLPMCVCNELLAKPSTDCSNHPSVKSQWGMAAFPLISFQHSFLHSRASSLLSFPQTCRDANGDKSVALAIVNPKQIECLVLRLQYKWIHSLVHITISLVQSHSCNLNR